MTIFNYSLSVNVAKKYGIYQALILERIVFSINYHEKDPKNWSQKYYVDGHWWMDDTYEAISNYFEGMIAVPTIKVAIRSFEKDGILISRQMQASKWVRTKWYSLNKDAYIDLYVGRNIAASEQIPNIPSEQISDVPFEQISDIPSSYTNSHTISLTNIESTRARTRDLSVSALTETQVNKSVLKEQKGTAKRSSTPTISKDITKASKRPQRPKKELNQIWNENDPLAQFFSNVMSLPDGAKHFDVDSYRQWIISVQKDFELSEKEVIMLSKEWQDYHNEAGTKIKAPKNSLRTWITNYVERRSTKYGKGTGFKPQKRSAHLEYDPEAFKHQNDDRPW
jgi:hypothetical protein